MGTLDFDGLTIFNQSRNFFNDEISGTTQTVIFSEDGKKVTQILHKKGTEVVRQDDFTYAENSITEARTISGLGTVTITTNLTTLETSVVFTAA